MMLKTMDINIGEVLCRTFFISAVCLMHFTHAFFISSQPTINVELFNGSYYTKVLKHESYSFPNIGKLFSNIDGIDFKKLEIVHMAFPSLDVQQLKRLTNLESLVVQHNKELKNIGRNTFLYNPRLYHLYLDENEIEKISDGGFNGLFNNKRASCELHLQNNKLKHFPAFTEIAPGLKHLNIDGNPIKQLPTTAFANLTHIEDFSMRRTSLESLQNGIFSTNIRLYKLRLDQNRNLKSIGDETFVGARNLKFLDLSSTGITHIPYQGLERLSDLIIEKTPNIWEIKDEIVSIPTLKNVRVAKDQRWLCCAFEMKRAVIHLSIPAKKHNTTSLCPDTNSLQSVTTTQAAKTSTYNPFGGFGEASRATPKPNQISTTEDPFGGFGGFGKRRRRQLDDFFGSFVGTSSSQTTKQTIHFNPFTDDFIHHTPKIHTSGVICNPNITSTVYAEEELAPVVCSPGPDALRPCDDIMGNVFLTSISWLVSIIALLGNSMVFCVLIMSRRSVSVTKFLLINLSFADLSLALYLFVLVSASSHTHGNYYNYVREWQFSGGCSIAGFLAIFSSQLSMLVLVVITVERYFAIVHAMHFHRRVSMNHAIIGMLVAWFISIFVAILPLAGVNSYTEVAICLPFRTESKGDLAYIGLLLILNLLFFLFVFSSYLRMFLVVRSPHLNNSIQQRSDSEVAKRMALLVFTDFFCWAPIAFVGLWSAFGDTETLGVTVKNSKFLLVLFFPINSLCNPFLYAVSTKSFKRDFYDLLIRCGVCHDYIARMNENMYTNSMSHKQSLRNQSETLTSSLGRHASSTRSPSGNGLLTKVLSKRMKLEHQNSHLSLPPTPERSNPSTPIADDVFTPTNKSENPFFPKSISKTSNLSQDSNENSLLLNVSNLQTSLETGSTVDDSEKLKARKTAGFSQYDLSPDAFHKAKETTCV